MQPRLTRKSGAATRFRETLHYIIFLHRLGEMALPWLAQKTKPAKRAPKTTLTRELSVSWPDYR